MQQARHRAERWTNGPIEKSRTMKYWNVHDANLLAALELSGLKDLRFDLGPEGGVAVTTEGEILGVWIEYRRGHYDYLPVGSTEATYRDCIIEQVVHSCAWIAANAVIQSLPAHEPAPSLRLVKAADVA